MTKWTKDISNKMRRLDSSQIGYTREEIRGKFLTVEETTGVYVLCAPRTNIESMKVEKEHVEVIMRNLIENGDFDYIIVDTGNNLRDSNYIPMQKADICLMIFQQDINAIRSNMDMLDTYAQLEGFDMSKIYMLYNAVRSQKETNVSIDSITNIVLANAREHGYELGGDIKSREDNPVYGVIPFLPNAQFTVNAGGIIVTDPTNDFTKAIGAIAARLNKVELQLAVPQKKGLFGRLVSLFGRNK
jgi:MinD-like ATPase involved in chromosome partitioning or flagellar assembly